ncbi:orc1/cdc6 family replication initiation protein (plasmid) [Methanohalobium evestigatum Z-7303]|uniref:ORC1-type DNA replication protein n=1 Tax=Methanohalobium evestigatum (strain ATCC BAA-1072 / DSM 3721 / NBRC 107634 / OCM 161 / Z-7303) TaxID=644295 RepID=D7EBV9_METEZ|nr:orc1/cdc6 family replication initiation protein [Methanohalobium evestigatum]ADI75081.1 orc1/cdc6 family replication initiation protein [Methanohalobium evestigatum Z-7303]
MGSIFNKNKPKIFKNKYSLSSEYVPERLIARDSQIEQIAELVEPVLSGEKPDNAFIYGKTGTGKTAVVRYVLKELQKELSTDNSSHVMPIFINCNEIGNTSHVLHEIIKTVDFNYKIPSSGISISEYYRHLWWVLNKNNYSIIVVFDEIEHLKDDNVLYNLSRAGEYMKVNPNVNIGIIGTTNDLMLKDQIDPRVMSSLAQHNFSFPPYDAEQLTQILNDRAEIAFNEDVLDNMVIPLCSALAAKEHGDARIALKLLENAGTIAKHENSPVVTEEHVYKADSKIDNDFVYDTVYSLPLHTKIVLLGIIELHKDQKKNCTTGEVVQKYQQICNINSVDALSRTRVSKMIGELDMLGLINAPLKTKGIRGRTRTITINKHIDVMENVLDKSLYGVNRSFVND